jgi:anti-anti-sigma regulatory factor
MDCPQRASSFSHLKEDENGDTLIGGDSSVHLVKVVDNVGVISLDPYISEGQMSSIDSLDEICGNLLTKGIDLCLLDMGEVKTVPSIFLAMMVTLQNKLNTTGGRLAILRPTKYVRKLLNITVVNELIEVYDSEDEAVKSLVEAKKAEYDSLLEMLNGEDVTSRFEVAKKLTRMGEQRGLDFLVDCLGSPDQNMRFQATLSLTDIGGDRVVVPLLKALRDEFYKIRCYAAEALGNIRAAEALNPLKQVIRFDHNRNVVAKASEAVDKIIHSNAD